MMETVFGKERFQFQAFDGLLLNSEENDLKNYEKNTLTVSF